MKAIESLSRGTLTCVPLRGEWTADRVEVLVDEAPLLGARLIANIQTGPLWGSHPSADQLLAELSGEQVTGPRPREPSSSSFRRPKSMMSPDATGPNRAQTIGQTAEGDGGRIRLASHPRAARIENGSFNTSAPLLGVRDAPTSGNLMAWS